MGAQIEGSGTSTLRGRRRHRAHRDRAHHHRRPRRGGDAAHGVRPRGGRDRARRGCPARASRDRGPQAHVRDGHARPSGPARRLVGTANAEALARPDRRRDPAVPRVRHRLHAARGRAARHRRRHVDRHRERVRQPVRVRRRAQPHGRRRPHRGAPRGDPWGATAVGCTGASARRPGRRGAPPRRACRRRRDHRRRHLSRRRAAIPTSPAACGRSAPTSATKTPARKTRERDDVGGPRGGRRRAGDRHHPAGVAGRRWRHRVPRRRRHGRGPRHAGGRLRHLSGVHDDAEGRRRADHHGPRSRRHRGRRRRGRRRRQR